MLARLVKMAMVAVLLPLALGLLLGVIEQLVLISVSSASAYDAIQWGFLTYVGIHLILFRPRGLFRFSHRVFSTIAVWLFGAQVASVDQAKTERSRKRGEEAPQAQGSTLVAFSPYMVPISTIMICALGWSLNRWLGPGAFALSTYFMIGVTTSFHWIMTADDLQEQRNRWHMETYLLAIGLIFVVTVLVISACLPWTTSEYSFVQALASGLIHTQEMYKGILQQLFF